MIGFSRGTFSGRSGVRASLGFASRSGVNQGIPVTVGVGETRRALARVLRDDWNAPGTTLTLRVYRTGPPRVLVTQGIVDSGPTTVKGVGQPNAALPMMTAPAFANDTFELEVETSGTLRYSGELVE